jgi:hypothetical protein
MLRLQAEKLGMVTIPQDVYCVNVGVHRVAKQRRAQHVVMRRIGGFDYLA